MECFMSHDKDIFFRIKKLTGETREAQESSLHDSFDALAIATIMIGNTNRFLLYQIIWVPSMVTQHVV